jgi:hypothetical protein
MSKLGYGSLLLFILVTACHQQPKITVENVTIESIDSNAERNYQPPPPPPPLPEKQSPPNPSFKSLNDWITNICLTENPDKNIIAYNFGLFETEEGYTIYLMGSETYDKKNDDWATSTDFSPEYDTYLLPSKEYKNLEWDKTLKKITKKLKLFTKSPTFNKSFLAKAKAITVGFDDGDLTLIK